MARVRDQLKRALFQFMKTYASPIHYCIVYPQTRVFIYFTELSAHNAYVKEIA